MRTYGPLKNDVFKGHRVLVQVDVNHLIELPHTSETIMRTYGQEQTPC